ncbi:hypothetical protein B0H66DRAFT_630542 [Apodospora peruviana]|uniref:BTB domain-containing protein n=1 Tax=Apodospora peruviana TaxID=516989 RepID=A0AAE0HWC9_9PEZI|nr:hypothetical protein B0H66DRAFT_630542 [Apodospora peruviana]
MAYSEGSNMSGTPNPAYMPAQRKGKNARTRTADSESEYIPDMTPPPRKKQAAAIASSSQASSSRAAAAGTSPANAATHARGAAGSTRGAGPPRAAPARPAAARGPAGPAHTSAGSARGPATPARGAAAGPAGASAAAARGGAAAARSPAATSTGRPRGRPPGSTGRPRGRPPKSGGAPIVRKPVPGARKEEFTGFDEETLASAKALATPAEPWAVNAHRSTANNIGVFEDGMFADASVMCIKKEWRVHRTVVCTRSTWFAKAFAPDDSGGQTDVVNLHDQKPEDVETLLRFIYAGSLDKDTKKSFRTYVKLYNLGVTFDLSTLCDDALSLLGQLCDAKLLQLCAYDVHKSGRAGVPVTDPQTSPVPWIDDMKFAVWTAFSTSAEPTRLQSLLCQFVWAGRDRLLHGESGVFRELVDKQPMFGAAMFKVMLGENLSGWIPDAEQVKQVCMGFDHSRKTQHPDRCAKCEEVFDEAQVRKALYHPFRAAVRAPAWCAPCVEAHPGPAPLWRAVEEEEE